MKSRVSKNETTSFHRMAARVRLGHSADRNVSKINPRASGSDKPLRICQGGLGPDFQVEKH